MREWTSSSLYALSHGAIPQLMINPRWCKSEVMSSYYAMPLAFFLSDS